jgi:hypothetical protein
VHRQRSPRRAAACARTRAAVLQVLYSAASWDLLRSFWDMDATEAADAIELGIRSLLSGLRILGRPRVE